MYSICSIELEVLSNQFNNRNNWYPVFTDTDMGTSCTLVSVWQARKRRSAKQLGSLRVEIARTQLPNWFLSASVPHYHSQRHRCCGD